MCSFNAHYFPVCLPTYCFSFYWLVGELIVGMIEWMMSGCLHQCLNYWIKCLPSDSLPLLDGFFGFFILYCVIVSHITTYIISFWRALSCQHTEQQQIKNQVPIQIVVRVRGGHLQEDEPFRTLGFQKTKILFFQFHVELLYFEQVFIRCIGKTSFDIPLSCGIIQRITTMTSW